MYKSKKVFALYHIYDSAINDITFKEIKRIGFFETEEQCVELISIYKKFNGFQNHPETCFKIFEYEIGRDYWRDEFLLPIDYIFAEKHL